MIIPLIVLAIVFSLIALRQLANARLQIWQLLLLKVPVPRSFQLQIWHIMLFGAIAVLLTGQISPLNAIQSVNLDVLLFLFGMFVVGRALEESGYLSHISDRLFGRAKTSDAMLLFVLFGFGFLAAFLMNDTVAIIGTPVVLLLAKSNGISAKPFLLALCFAVTIGSAMSPIGNPQNLLIATNGGIAQSISFAHTGDPSGSPCIANPFASFFGRLLVPTVINLLVAFALLKFFYKGSFGNKPVKQRKEEIKDRRLMKISKLSLGLLASLIALKIAFAFTGVNIDIRLIYIALIAALPIMVFSRKRVELVKSIDWSTLVFFASMFVLMESVWETGFFQSFVAGSGIASLGTIFFVSIVVSQFISNVPLVALYLPMLAQAGASAPTMIALAAGSTIAGNLFILGAASNIIIIQNAERSGQTLTFAEFAKIGIPLTVINVLVYWIFLGVI